MHARIFLIQDKDIISERYIIISEAIYMYLGSGTAGTMVRQQRFFKTRKRRRSEGSYHARNDRRRGLPLLKRVHRRHRIMEKTSDYGVDTRRRF